MKRRDAISEAQRLADAHGRAFIVYRLTRRHEYEVRASLAPGNDLLKIECTVRPRPPKLAPAVAISLDCARARG